MKYVCYLTRLYHTNGEFIQNSSRKYMTFEEAQKEITKQISYPDCGYGRIFKQIDNKIYERRNDNWFYLEQAT